MSKCAKILLFEGDYIMENQLFSKYLTEWLDLRRLTLQSSTYNSYLGIVKRCSDYFYCKKITISSLTDKDINLFYSYLSKQGISNNRIVKYHAVLFTCIKSLVIDDTLPSNILLKINRPKTQQNIVKYYTNEEITLLSNYLVKNYKNKLSAPVLLSLSLGLRRSEVFGLSWDNIDIKNNKIHITQKLIYNYKLGKLELSKYMKNKSSARTLSIPDFLIDFLIDLKDYQTQVVNENPKSQKGINKQYAFVCLDQFGCVMLPDYATKNWIKIPKLLNIRTIKFHELRHSNATMLFNLGCDIKEVQEWLGHSKQSTTADIYIHLTHKNKDKLANLINTNLSPSI